MASVSPTRLLPGVYVIEQFPQVAAVATGATPLETLIGPVRTIVPGEQGILGGPAFSTLAPLLSSAVTKWQFTVAVTGIGTAVVSFAGTVINFTALAATRTEDFVIALRASLLTGTTASYIKDIQTAVTGNIVTGDTITVTILASDNAIATGFFPSMTFAVTGLVVVNSSINPVTVTVAISQEAETNVSLPTLPANWLNIKNRRVMEEVIYSLDASRQGVAFSEPERFYFDLTTRMNDALTSYIGLSTQAKAFYGDFLYFADASAAAGSITVSKPVLNGTQRVTAISVNTGVEYELRLTYDYTVSNSRVAGAYQEGDSVSLSSPATLDVFGTGPILVRLVYVPDRYVMPLPVLNYTPLTPGAVSVLSPMPLTAFTFDASGSSIAMDHVAPPTAARFSYTSLANVTKVAGSLSQDVNLAPRLAKTFSVNATGISDTTFDTSALGLSNIDASSIIVTRADGTVLAGSGTDYSFASGVFTFVAAGPLAATAAASNPLQIKLVYVPQVTFVGAPTLVTNVAAGLLNYTPALTHLGGGLYNINTPGYVATIAITSGTAKDFHTGDQITFTGGVFATAATATVVSNLAIVNLAITTGTAAGFVTGDTITFDTVAGGTFTTPAIAVVTSAAGAIDSISFTAPGATKGTGYTAVPTNFSVTTGVGVKGTATITAGATIGGIDSIVLTSPGIGYTAIPTGFTVGTGTGVAGSAAITATPTLGPANASIVATVMITATVEYPIQPQIQLEFMAERGDLDGQLFFPTSALDLTNSALLADVYASQAIAPNLTIANPTLHAAAMALSVTGPSPVCVAVGDFVSGRIEKALNALQSQPNPYWLVPITQDSSAALSLIGAHVDTMVATINGLQIHYAPGGFRNMMTTLDQRNEVSVIPEAADTLFGVGYLVNAGTGGIAVRANLTGVTGDPELIVPGYYVEFYQADPTNAAAIVGNTVAKPIPRRLKIVAVDVSTPSAALFTVTDASLPAILDADGAADTTFYLKLGAPFRVLNVRSDADLSVDFQTATETRGAATNGMRRWTMQPDICTITDVTDNALRGAPGYYKAVMTEAVREINPANVSMTRQPIPRIAGVNRNRGFYSTDDIINGLTSAGVDYAVQEVTNGPVSSLQELTSNRFDQWTQAPMVLQVVDMAARKCVAALDPFIGSANIQSGTLSAVTMTCGAVIREMMETTGDSLHGPLILEGRVIEVGRLSATSTNPGIFVVLGITSSQEVGEIRVTIDVDTPPQS